MTHPCGRKYCTIDECHDLGCREVYGNKPMADPVAEWLKGLDQILGFALTADSYTDRDEYIRKARVAIRSMIKN